MGPTGSPHERPIGPAALTRPCPLSCVPQTAARLDLESLENELSAVRKGAAALSDAVSSADEGDTAFRKSVKSFITACDGGDEILFHRLESVRALVLATAAFCGEPPPDASSVASAAAAAQAAAGATALVTPAERGAVGATTGVGGQLGEPSVAAAALRVVMEPISNFMAELDKCVACSPAEPCRGSPCVQCVR